MIKFCIIEKLNLVWYLVTANKIANFWTKKDAKEKHKFFLQNTKVSVKYFSETNSYIFLTVSYLKWITILTLDTMQYTLIVAKYSLYSTTELLVQFLYIKSW